MSTSQNQHCRSAAEEEEDRKPLGEADEAAATAAARAKDEYERGLLIRGEAVEAKDGKLPPGATHEIVGKTADGRPILRRRRFSAF